MASVIVRARATVPVLPTIQSHVRLTRSGRVYTGLCPFHGDRHRPNLVVFPATDTWKCFSCGAGGDGLDFLARTTGQPLRQVIASALGSSPAPVGRPALPPPSTDPVAPLAVRDRVYRRLLRHLSLSARHRTLLGGRGVPAAVAWRRGYRSLTPGDAPWPVPEGVPGFFAVSSEVRRWRLAGPAGLALPVRDVSGAIQALHLRPDHGPGKYVWWSTPGRPGGASSGAPVHVARRGTAVVWITEGPLKADSVAEHLAITAVGVPGVSLWRAALPVLHALNPTMVVLALDQDAAPSTAAAVAAHQAGLAAACQDHWAVAVAHWPAGFKGVDDALAAGLAPTVRAWPGPPVTHRPPE